MHAPKLVGLLALPIFLTAADDAGRGVTFTKDIAPIFREKCEACHRKDSMAPMSLVTYQETRPWAKSIKERVVTRQMPPWHLDPAVGIQEFQNDRSLTKEQIATIARWVDSGAPMGNPKDAPAPKQWPDETGWQLAKQYGPPDLVIQSDPYTIPAVSQDQWWRPTTEVHLAEPRWVRAVEMRPSTPAGRKVTHHAIGYLLQTEPKGQGPVDDPFAALAGGGILMEWAVGKQYDVYRPNTGKLLMPGAKIWWDIHYHAVGEEIRDHVEMAVYFYPKGETPKYRTYLTMFNAASVNCRWNAAGYCPEHRCRNPRNARPEASGPAGELSAPHASPRKGNADGAILPDGKVETLSYVNNFNFNWMNNYIYAEDAAPVLPKGTTIRVKAWHDNTTAKASNPDPNQWVGWGDRTVDEMAHAWVNVTYISDADYADWAAKHQRK